MMTAQSRKLSFQGERPDGMPVSATSAAKRLILVQCPGQPAQTLCCFAHSAKKRANCAMIATVKQICCATTAPPPPPQRKYLKNVLAAIPVGTPVCTAAAILFFFSLFFIFFYFPGSMNRADIQRLTTWTANLEILAVIVTIQKNRPLPRALSPFDKPG